MTPNTPAEIAREIVAEMEGIYDHAASMSLSARPNFLWLQGRIAAAVQAAERRAVERCAQIAATTGRIVTDGITSQGRYEQGYARARHDIEESIRALDLGASKEE